MGDRRRRSCLLGHVGIPRPGPGRTAVPAARSGCSAVLDGAGCAPAALPDRRREGDQLPGRDGWAGPVDGAPLQAFAGWHPAVTEMIGAVPQSPRSGLFTRRPLTRWNRGPVVLLGDAAHAMLPHQGQGANQAIEDAAVLAAELDGASDVLVALGRYAR